MIERLEAQMYKNEVNTAFEILLEEIESVVNELSREGEKAFKEQNFEKAKSVIETATKLTSFREKVKELQKEWKNLISGRLPEKTYRRKGLKKLKKGLRTPEDEFRIPILESLVELGGRAEMKEVLKKVKEKMGNRLNQYDLEGLPSNLSQKRWENTAQWCRNTLVTEKLLSPDSPKGIWEITPEGRSYLKTQKNSSSG